MEEDIKNMSKEELLEYLEDISQQLDNIALDQIQFAISELQFFKEEYKKLEEENKKQSIQIICYQEELENSIPTSVIEEKKKEVREEFNKVNTAENNEWYIDSEKYSYAEDKLQEILEEGRR